MSDDKKEKEKVKVKLNQKDILTPENVSYLKNLIMARESGGKGTNTGIFNSSGYFGLYQFGAQALEDIGLLKPGTWAKNKSLGNKKVLEDKNNWTEGNNFDKFKTREAQEKAMDALINKNFQYIKTNLEDKDITSVPDILGYVAGAHLVGQGAAKQLISDGKDKQDGNGTKASDYLNYVKNNFALAKQATDQGRLINWDPKQKKPIISETVDNYFYAQNTGRQNRETIAEAEATQSVPNEVKTQYTPRTSQPIESSLRAENMGSTGPTPQVKSMLSKTKTKPKLITDSGEQNPRQNSQEANSQSPELDVEKKRKGLGFVDDGLNLLSKNAQLIYAEDKAEAENTEEETQFRFGGLIAKAKKESNTPKKSKLEKTKDKVVDAAKTNVVLSQIPYADTAYDAYNVGKAINDGDAVSLGHNFVGALIPGLSGKVIEASTSEIIPKTPEQEKKKFKKTLETSPSERMQLLKKYGPGYLNNPQFKEDYNFKYGGLNENKNYLVNEFNEGGTHETNPNGGVVIKDDMSVEEGETSIDTPAGKYIYSDSLYVSEEDIEDLRLPKDIKPGMSYADASKYINDIMAEDPNNKILANTSKKYLDSLIMANEKARELKESTEVDLSNIDETQQEFNLGGLESLTGSSAIGGGLGAVTTGMGLIDMAQGNTDVKTGKSIGMGALSGAGAGAAFGPWGAAAGAVIGGVAGGIGAEKAQKKLNEENIMNIKKENSKFTSDFKYGGMKKYDIGGYGPQEINPLTDSIIQYGISPALNYNNSIGEMAFVDFDKNNENIYPQQEDPLSASIRQYGIPASEKKEEDKPAFKPKGISPLQYAGLGASALNYLQTSKQKPEVEKLDRLTTRFQPDYVDERAILNTLSSDSNNMVNNIANASGGSGSKFLANYMASNSNISKAKSDAYLKMDDINRGQNLEGQKYNLGVDQLNINQSNNEMDINARNRAATEDRKAAARDALLRDIGSLGKEMTANNKLYNFTGGYNQMGKYNAGDKSALEMLFGSKDDNEDTTNRKNGGFLGFLNKREQKKAEFENIKKMINNI